MTSNIEVQTQDDAQASQLFAELFDRSRAAGVSRPGLEGGDLLLDRVPAADQGSIRAVLFRVTRLPD